MCSALYRTFFCFTDNSVESSRPVSTFSQQPWHSCHKLIYVRPNPKTGVPVGHWPIPESFWPDQNSPTLVSREASKYLRSTFFLVACKSVYMLNNTGTQIYCLSHIIYSAGVTLSLIFLSFSLLLAVMFFSLWYQPVSLTYSQYSISKCPTLRTHSVISIICFCCKDITWSILRINKSNHFFHYLHVLLPATSLCTSHGAFFLCGLWAHGDRQASLWQVWTGAVSTHPVRFGKEVSTHVLAGTVNILTPISSVGLFLLSLVLPLGLFWKPEIMRLQALFKIPFNLLVAVN